MWWEIYIPERLKGLTIFGVVYFFYKPVFEKMHAPFLGQWAWEGAYQARPIFRALGTEVYGSYERTQHK